LKAHGIVLQSSRPTHIGSCEPGSLLSVRVVAPKGAIGAHFGPRQPRSGRTSQSRQAQPSRRGHALLLDPTLDDDELNTDFVPAIPNRVEVLRPDLDLRHVICEEEL